MLRILSNRYLISVSIWEINLLKRNINAKKKKSLPVFLLKVDLFLLRPHAIWNCGFEL